MNIQAAEVKRDESGFWTHPELPEWDEATTTKEIEAWLNDQGLDLHVDWFEHSASEELQKKWFEDGDIDCREWQPHCPADGAFILSIHDNEDGPLALFAFKKPGFERENRYMVAKRKDVYAALHSDERAKLETLLQKVSDHRLSKGKPILECAVVENDWPEHELIWQMIQARVETTDTSVQTTVGMLQTYASFAGTSVGHSEAATMSAAAVLIELQEKEVSEQLDEIEYLSNSAIKRGQANAILNVENQKLKDLLVHSMAGLKWYKTEHPGSWLEADEEHLAECNTVLNLNTKEETSNAGPVIRD